MSKIKTGVLVVSLSTVFSITTYTNHLQAQSNSIQNGNNFQDRTIEKCDAKLKINGTLITDKTQNEYAKCIDEETNKLLNSIGQNNSIDKQNCDKASENYKKIKTDLEKICMENQMGLADCASSIQTCNDVILKGDHEVHVSSSGAQIMEPETVSQIAKECPPYIAERMKDWKSIAEKGQEKINKLQEDLNKSKKEQQETMTQLQEEVTKQEEKIKELTNEEEDLIKKTPTLIADLTSQMKGEITKLQGSFEKDRQQLAQLETAYEEGIAKYNNDVGQIGAQCKEAAIKEFREILRLQDNNAGGIFGLRDDKKRSLTLQNRMINWNCNQPSTFNARAAAARALSVSLNANQRMVQLLKERIASEPKIMNDLYESFNNQQKKLVADSQSKLQKLASQKNTAMQKLSTQSALNAQKIQIAQQRTTQLEQQLQLAQTDFALANADIKAASNISTNSENKASSRTVAGLMSSFIDFSGAYCKAKFACETAKSPGLAPSGYSFAEKSCTTSDGNIDENIAIDSIKGANKKAK